MQFPGTHAPTPAELEIESIPYNLPMCFDAKETLQARNTHNSQTTQQSSTLSDAEKAKMLQEVEPNKPTLVSRNRKQKQLLYKKT